jgi:preprotein translocase subunit Sec61beta
LKLTREVEGAQAAVTAGLEELFDVGDLALGDLFPEHAVAGAAQLFGLLEIVEPIVVIAAPARDERAALVVAAGRIHHVGVDT